MIIEAKDVTPGDVVFVVSHGTEGFLNFADE